jgi:GMP synthase (glutamine-hydrolysing)
MTARMINGKKPVVVCSMSRNAVPMTNAHPDPLSARLGFLLLQVRNADDAMRRQEVRCFARALACDEQQIRVFDLLTGAPTAEQLRAVDVVLLGGSGDYSVATGGPWLPAALDAMRTLHDLGKPTFASCWGFQAMARALGGQVETDLNRAELGSIPIQLTDDGQRDPIFGPLGGCFLAQMGHQDIVEQLPPGVVLLASSERVRNQAFRCPGKPIYCTQFHPELNLHALLERVSNYPWYVERIAGISSAAFIATCRETPETDSLLLRFLHHTFGTREQEQAVSG